MFKINWWVIGLIIILFILWYILVPTEYEYFVNNKKIRNRQSSKKNDRIMNIYD